MDRLLADSQVRITESLRANRRVGAVAWIDDGVVGQSQELTMEAQQHLLRTRAGEIDAADLSREQRVAREGMVADPEGETAGRMAWRYQDLQGKWPNGRTSVASK